VKTTRCLNARPPAGVILGSLLFAGCATSEDDSFELPLAWGEPENVDGGQSGDEGTQMASPCLPEERAAFLGELNSLDSGVARVLLHQSLTPAAAVLIDSFPAEIEGAATGYFTTGLPALGRDVLVVFSPQPSQEVPASIAIAEVKNGYVSLTACGASTRMRVEALRETSCFSDWDETCRASSMGTGAQLSGETPLERPDLE
jgi:hypothetical protein